MSAAAVAISLAMEEIARRLSAELDQVAGEHVMFTLVCFTPGASNYLSNTCRDDSIRELKRLLEQWESGMPDVPVHAKN